MSPSSRAVFVSIAMASACTGKDPATEHVELATKGEPVPAAKAEAESGSPPTMAKPDPDKTFGAGCQAYFATVEQFCSGGEHPEVCGQASARIHELNNLPTKKGTHEAYDWLCDAEAARFRDETPIYQRPSK